MLITLCKLRWLGLGEVGPIFMDSLSGMSTSLESVDQDLQVRFVHGGLAGDTVRFIGPGTEIE